MKDNLIILAATAAALLSCGKDAQNDGPKPSPRTPESTRCFFAEYAASSTKTTVSDKTLVWEAGDRVAVWDADGSKSTYTALSSGPTTLLEGPETSAQQTYLALSPDNDGAAVAGGEIYLTLPAAPVLQVGTVPVVPAVATTDGASRDFVFHGVCGLISFHISRNDIVSIVFTGNSGENVAGGVKVNMQNPASLHWEAVSGVKALVLRPVGAAFERGSYYLPVLAQRYPKGFSMTLTTATGDITERNCVIPFSIGNGAVLEAGDIDDIDYWNGSVSVATALEFRAFMRHAAQCDKSVTVTLKADIDFSGEDIPSAESFAGTFVGGGYRLKGGAFSGPLFKELSGTVRELIVDRSCSYDIKAEGGANNEDLTAGLIAGNNRGSILNCTNEAPITSSSHPGMGNIGRVGAFAGQNLGTLSGCTNKGAISLNMAGRTLNIGGITGVSTDGTLTSCSNRGDISITLVDKECRYLRMGGIVGDRKTGVSLCSNSGNITLVGGDGAYGSESNGNYILGGISGFGSGSNFLLQGSADHEMLNTGNITATDSYCGIRAGGIEGQGNAGNHLYYARNKGAVSIQSDATGCYAGGLRGICRGEVCYSVNEGSVLLESGGASGCAGGLAGTLETATLMESVASYGDVSYTRKSISTSNAYAALGVGYVSNTADVVLRDCILGGKLSATLLSGGTLLSGAVTGLAKKLTLGAAGLPVALKADVSVLGVAVDEDKIHSVPYLCGGTDTDAVTLTDVTIIE